MTPDVGKQPTLSDVVRQAQSAVSELGDVVKATVYGEQPSSSAPSKTRPSASNRIDELKVQLQELTSEVGDIAKLVQVELNQRL